jgi:protein-disulfide isomerase
LRISGTPSFVVGKEIVRGLTDASSLKRLIASARGS